MCVVVEVMVCMVVGVMCVVVEVMVCVLVRMVCGGGDGVCAG